MKFVYCANCGLQLPITRKAMPRYATIIDLVPYHECSEEPHEIDLKPVNIPTYQFPEKSKFVQKLNNLDPAQVVRAKLGGIDSNDLRDRRFEQNEEVKSTAPTNVLGLLKDMETSIPDKPLTDLPDSEENK